MRTLCAYCPAVILEGDSSERPSHGICELCSQDQIRQAVRRRLALEQAGDLELQVMLIKPRRTETHV
jgi:hypothetical protein